ncbi:hypothetical protein Hanom_Chr09g00820941 [Helianthus anomalus]
MFIAISFPFFGELLNFFGGFVFAPTTYFVRNFNAFLIFFNGGRKISWYLCFLFNILCS